MAFALDSLSFVISAFCLMAIPRKRLLHKSESAQSGVIKDLHQGIQTVLQSPWLWICIAIAGLSNITLSGPFQAALPLLVEQRFGAHAQTYGLLMTLSAVGSLVATMWIGRRKRLRRRGYLVYGAWLLVSLMLVLMDLPLALVGSELDDSEPRLGKQFAGIGSL